MKKEVISVGTRRFEMVVNIALTVAALAFVGFLAQRFLLKKDAPTSRAAILESGSKLTWPNTDWTTNGETLVLALSANCHFCTESAPFYQKLLSELPPQNRVRTIAVLPQPISEGQKYLQDLGVSVDEVRRAELASIGLPATPTLALVNSEGVVTAVWVGKLGVNEQYDVFNHLNIKTNSGLATAESGVTRIDANVLKHAVGQKERFELVDVSEREKYDFEHISAAVNIPLDELEARASNELSPSDTIVIYSHEYDDNLSENAIGILVNEGFKKVSLLKHGYSSWRPNASAEVSGSK